MLPLFVSVIFGLNDLTLYLFPSAYSMHFRNGLVVHCSPILSYFTKARIELLKNGLNYYAAP